MGETILLLAIVWTEERLRGVEEDVLTVAFSIQGLRWGRVYLNCLALAILGFTGVRGAFDSVELTLIPPENLVPAGITETAASFSIDRLSLRSVTGTFLFSSTPPSGVILSDKVFTRRVRPTGSLAVITVSEGGFRTRCEPSL